MLWAGAQLEFMALSDKTGRAVFADKVEQVVRTLNDHFPNQARPCMCHCGCCPETLCMRSQPSTEVCTVINAILRAAAHVIDAVLPGMKVALVCGSTVMNSRMILQALLPLFISPLTGRGTTDAVSLGAMGDSYYEYLLKARPPLDAS